MNKKDYETLSFILKIAGSVFFVPGIALENIWAMLVGYCFVSAAWLVRGMAV